MNIHPKLIGALVISMSVPFAVANGVTTQPSDVTGQGVGGPVIEMANARLMRSGNGLNIQFVMPTPAVGSYNYPAGNGFQPEVIMGAPEVFTGWAFIFNYPEECSDPCDFDDLGSDKPAKGAAYNFAGHVVGGSTLRLSGRISVGDTPFPAAPGHPLENPMGAEVHVAIAPHGQVQPDLLPVQITSPIGTTAHWWYAFFNPQP